MKLIKTYDTNVDSQLYRAGIEVLCCNADLDFYIYDRKSIRILDTASAINWANRHIDDADIRDRIIFFINGNNHTNH